MQKHARALGLPSTQTETRQLLLSMKASEENMVWLQEHYARLILGYNRRWVAVHQSKVVESDASREALLSRLRAEHPDYNLYAIQYVTDDIIDYIL